MTLTYELVQLILINNALDVSKFIAKLEILDLILLD